MIRHYRLIHNTLKHIQIKVKKRYNFQGNSLNNLRRFEDTIKTYDKALQINPQCYEAYSNKGKEEI